MNENQEHKSAEELNYEDVLISVANPETARQLVNMAYHVTTYQTTFHIMNVTLQGSFPREERSWRKGTELVMDTTHYAQRLGRVAKPLTATANSVPRAIINSAKEIEADFILMGWFGRITSVAVRRSSVVNKVLHRAPCDVGVLKSRKDLAEVEKILMPVGPNKPRPKRLVLLERILRQKESKVELAHVLTGKPSEQSDEKASEYLSEVLSLMSDRAEMSDRIDTRIIHASSVLSGLLTASEDADLILLGPGREWVFDRFLFGRTADNLTNRVESSVLMFKGSEHKMVAWGKGLLKAVGDLIKRFV